MIDFILELFKFIYLGFKSIILFPIYIVRYFLIGLKTIFISTPKSVFSKTNINLSTKNKKLISNFMFCCSLSVYLICIFLTSRWGVQQIKNINMTNNIINSTNVIVHEEEEFVKENDEKEKEDKKVYYPPSDYWNFISVPYINVDFNDLLQRNSETVGWIKVENTNINYPIVQHNDNAYYLKHSFNGSNNNSGWVFLDFRNDFGVFNRNNIIYAHNMYNKTMFGSLFYVNENWWLNNKDNHYIKISTPTTNTVWQIFSKYTIPEETYYLTTGFTDTTFKKYLSKSKNRSEYDFKTTVSIDNKIITLSTCGNAAGTTRLVVHAKMIKIVYK